MSTKHTPWTCGPSVSPSEYGVTITDARGHIVASTYAEHGRLIAAAPETAAERDRLQAENAALVAALRHYERVPCPIPGHDYCARAALAAHAARTQEGPR